MLTRCVHYLSSDVFMLKYTKNSLSFLKSSIACHYIYRVGSCGLFHASECDAISGKGCSLEFAMHCGIFQEANVPVHWKDFVIETALKMADSLISALTTEQGS